MRLLKEKASGVSAESPDEELSDAPGFAAYNFTRFLLIFTHFTQINDEQPCYSRSIPQPSQVSLSEIFPDVPANALEELSSADLNEAANLLIDQTEPNFVQISENTRHRLTVEKESILEDCLCYYKSPNFNPAKPLRIVFVGQAAIDAGGPLRQFFSLISEKLSQNLFEGNPIHLLLKIDTNTILCELFIVVGKIITHSIVHGCNGFPFLSKAAYHYICTGNIMDAACFVTLDQVSSTAYKHYIKEVYTFSFFNSVVLVSYTF